MVSCPAQVYLVLQCCLLNVDTSIAVSQRSRAGSPSMRNLASKEMISDSVELWDADVLFLAHPSDGDKCSASEDTKDST